MAPTLNAETPVAIQDNALCTFNIETIEYIDQATMAGCYSKSCCAGARKKQILIVALEQAYVAAMDMSVHERRENGNANANANAAAEQL